MNSRRAEVLVLGAGLQGTGVALELARRGIPCTLVDQDELPLNRASLRNEGKIHLGLIYANDRSLATAQLQLDGALCFRSIVTGWVGSDAEWLSRSTPFYYLIAEDSVVAPDDLAHHYRVLGTRCRQLLDQDARLDYLGAKPQLLARALSPEEISERFNPGRFSAGFATPELAIDPEIMAKRLRRAVAEARNLTFAPSHVVHTITEELGGFRVEGDGPAGSWSIRARQVVNATWERRFVLDRQLGMQPPPHLLHRLKYRVIARLPKELHGAPSVTMVLGPYGDVVIRTDGTAYLSWYPAGLRGWSPDVEPPAAWNAACRGEVSPAERVEISSRILAAIHAWYPGIARCEPLSVDAGVIVALGESDVNDPSSGLHDRSRIGVMSRGGYHSVNTGKLTTAPLFAIEAANRVEAIRSGGRAPA